MSNVVTEGRPLETAPAAYRAALDGTDSNTWGAAPIKVAGADKSAQPTNGNPTLVVSPRFSVASATATIVCGLWLKVGSTWTLLGATEVTATASADQVDSASLYLGTEIIPFALDGATHYELRAPTVSSGNVTLVPHVVGPNPKGPSA